MFKSFAFLQSRGKLKFLFLASHGLRGHLSALRWASGRLRKSDAANLSREQRKLITEIHHHTRVLTTAFHSMLLVGRLEEKEYHRRPEPIVLAEVLGALTQGAEYQGADWNLSCDPHLRVQADPNLLHALLVNLLTLCIEATEGAKKVFVDAHASGGKVRVRLYAPWELPVLAATSGHGGSLSDQQLGGTPGLMLSLAAELATYERGTVELEEIASEDDDLIHDGTVERGENAVGEYRVALTLPEA